MILLAQIGIDIGTLPTDVVMAGVVVGTLLPAAISLVNRWQWPSEAKAVSAFVCCLLAAVVLCYFSGYFTGRDVLSMVLVVFFVAQFVFHTFWRPSQIADNIERATG